MNNKNKLIIIAVVALLLIIVGVSYAYFSAQISGSESGTTITTSAGTLNVVFNGGTTITASNVYPQDNPVATKTFTVTGTNTTSLTMPYTLSLIMDTNTLSTGALTYTLTSTNTSTNGTVVPSISTQKSITTGSSTITLGSGYFANGTSSVHTYILNIYFPSTESNQNADQGKSFTAHVGIVGSATGVPDGWDESTSGTLLYALKSANSLTTPLTVPGQQISSSTNISYADNGQTITLDTRNLTSYSTSYYFTYGTGYTFDSSTGLYTLTGTTTIKYLTNYADLVDKYIVSSDGTSSSSGQTVTNVNNVYKVSSATYNSGDSTGVLTYYEYSKSIIGGESELSSTADDYGVSYYFRGNVTNNYIVFANMCWRIVRVTGNGAIKLILYNYNPNSVSNPCDHEQESATSAYARYSGSTYTGAYNTLATDNAYIGFMYGTANSDNYTDTHSNINKSLILTNLETWYTSKLSTYSSYLADTIWCNDKKISLSNVFSNTYLGYARNQTVYSAVDRIKYAVDISQASPSLICPNDSNNGKLSKFTVDDTINGNGELTYKIGLLTADEGTYAGWTVRVENKNYYLNQNATSGWWWTLTPVLTSSGSGALMYNIQAPSGYINAYTNNTNGAIRPVISLVSSTQVTGTGTANDPYEVTGY